MNRGVGIFALGSAVLLLAAIGFLYFTTSEVGKIKDVSMAPGEVKNLTYHLSPGTYVMVITADERVNYTLSDANGTPIKRGSAQGRVKEKFTVKTESYYVLTIVNGKANNRVAILLEDEASLQKSQNTENTLFATCIIGIVLAMAGMIVSFMRIKR